MPKLPAWTFLCLAFFSTTVWSAAPCTTATPACTEWIDVGPGSVLIYRSYALNDRNEAITRALVMVHGYGRNVESYFRTALVAGTRAGALADTLIVAPRFASNQGNCRDTLAARELSWKCDGAESWRSGGAAVGNAGVTSFDVGDAIARRLARKEHFPNLGSIVVAGHSAGGQYSTRYAMANELHESLGVSLTYVVANPSSYTYPDTARPAAVGIGRNCATFNDWPYGMQNRNGYSARSSTEQLTRRVVLRPTTFLVGELDVLPESNFDASCPAMAQGSNRLERGLAYVRYLNERLGAKHRAVVIPACGHSARCMFTADPALPLLFP